MVKTSSAFSTSQRMELIRTASEQFISRSSVFPSSFLNIVFVSLFYFSFFR